MGRNRGHISTTSSFIYNHNELLNSPNSEMRYQLPYYLLQMISQNNGKDDADVPDDIIDRNVPRCPPCLLKLINQAVSKSMSKSKRKDASAGSIEEPDVDGEALDMLKKLKKQFGSQEMTVDGHGMLNDGSRKIIEDICSGIIKAAFPEMIRAAFESLPSRLFAIESSVLDMKNEIEQLKKVVQRGQTSSLPVSTPLKSGAMAESDQSHSENFAEFMRQLNTPAKISTKM